MNSSNLEPVLFPPVKIASFPFSLWFRIESGDRWVINRSLKPKPFGRPKCLCRSGRWKSASINTTRVPLLASICAISAAMDAPFGQARVLVTRIVLPCYDGQVGPYNLLIKNKVNQPDMIRLIFFFCLKAYIRAICKANSESDKPFKAVNCFFSSSVR